MRGSNPRPRACEARWLCPSSTTQGGKRVYLHLASRRNYPRSTDVVTTVGTGDTATVLPLVAFTSGCLVDGHAAVVPHVLARYTVAVPRAQGRARVCSGRRVLTGETARRPSSRSRSLHHREARPSERGLHGVTELPDRVG